MRREPYGVGSFVHVVKRGARGIAFLKENKDRDRLLLQIRHFNDVTVSPYWLRDLIAEQKHHTFERADAWEEQEPIVKVHAFCIHTNHFHLLLEEIVENGISRYMHKTGIGISEYLNEKYNEFGSPFQGPYRSKTIDSDEYLRYVLAYIQVKNVFEQFPDGYDAASKRFDEAYEWALRFPYGSIFDHEGDGVSMKRHVVSGDIWQGLWRPGEFKSFSRDVIDGRAHIASHLNMG